MLVSLAGGPSPGTRLDIAAAKSRGLVRLASISRIAQSFTSCKLFLRATMASMKDDTHVALYLPERQDWVDIAHEARRWELDEERVAEMVEQVEEEKELEVTLKLKRREQELLEYLRRAHDKEAQRAICKWEGCTATGWDTWGDMAAHVRVHLIFDSEMKGGFQDEKNIRATLADAEKLVHPVDALEVKVKTVRADRDVLLKKVAHGLSRLLKEPSPSSSASLPPGKLGKDEPEAP